MWLKKFFETKIEEETDIFTEEELIEYEKQIQKEIDE